MTFHNPCPALWDFSSLQAPIVTAWSDRQHVGTFTEETSLENRKKFVAAIRSFARALWKRYHLECEGISTEYWVQQNLLGFRCDLGELICQRLGWDYRLIDLIEEPLITTCAHHYTQVEDPTSCWGLARISNKEWGPNQMPTSFNYDPMGGDGVTVIVIDSGVKENHPVSHAMAMYLERARTQVVT
ncbi:hypothetical protein FN846DRAFT_987505 [Sphaerosporella brunnea]|uniref:Peptidase S8/S53 domain-containing protein n=1 Tax=Sphaerosporella brunnea TaxID=1250544 RepID=A0A5J5F9Q8_9PEZI|nr:hypothetical protein FN846DRAFT_987505 [Sphaerosporella brunnea]